MALEAVGMPTITIQVHRWAQGWTGRPYRHTANALHVVLQGHGQTQVGEHSFDWEFGDTIALPAWQRVQHRASANAVVVSLSDENLQRWTQLYRLQALD
jgi:gentisate 1,2-dioxygenase